MANRRNRATAATEEAGTEMPRGEMAAPPGPSIDMPSGDMPGEEASAFVPATRDMPRGEMAGPVGGVLAGLTAGLGAAALAEMPGGEMAPVEAATAPQPTIEIEGSWRLLLTSSLFKSDGR